MKRVPPSPEELARRVAAPKPKPAKKPTKPANKPTKRSTA